MGQKVNPHGMRVGVIKDWDSRWYAEADFADNLIEDHEIRTYLKKRLYSAGISKIEIERASDRIKIIVHTAKPGVVIGKVGTGVTGGIMLLTARHQFPQLFCGQCALPAAAVPNGGRGVQQQCQLASVDSILQQRQCIIDLLQRTDRCGGKAIIVALIGTHPQHQMVRRPSQFLRTV